jgi:hypothetical protein
MRGIIIAAGLMNAIGACATTISLQPVADTTLQQAFPDNNLGDGSTVTAGGRRNGGATRALFLFDITSNIPAGATITAVSVNLTVVGTPSGGATSTFDLHQVLAGWGEGNGSDRSGGSPGQPGQATWDDRQGAGIPWNTAGGDFSATASATRSITGNGLYTFVSTPNLISDVQSWLDNPTNNFGWELISESETVPASIRRFASRDDGINGPIVLVQYNVPEPAVLSLALVGIGCLAWPRLKRK